MDGFLEFEPLRERGDDSNLFEHAFPTASGPKEARSFELGCTTPC